jgi:hypothetical protein
MLSATIDWRDETARCVGVFRSEDAAALEVEYRVHLDHAILDLLARAFLKAGVPVLRGSAADLPAVRLLGDTLAEHIPVRRPSAPTAGATGGPKKVDKRTRAWKEQQRKAALVAAGRNNGGGAGAATEKARVA